MALVRKLHLAGSQMSWDVQLESAAFWRSLVCVVFLCGRGGTQSQLGFLYSGKGLLSHTLV